MTVFDRSVLWVGRPSWLVSITGPPFAPRVAAVEEGPAFRDAEPNAFTGWLSGRLPKGRPVDIVYAQHLFRVEAFTGVAPGDLAGAMKLRLKKDLLISVEGLHGLHVPLVSGGKSQVVFAGALTGVHSLVKQVLESAGARIGRVGFAGQLALRALVKRAPRGGWTVLSDVALAGRMLLACADDGQLAIAAYPASGVDLAATGAQIVRLNLPRAEVAAAPVDLAAPARELRPLLGAALSAPLSFALPVFLRESAWRLPSPTDERYPYVLAPQTWGFAAVLAGALVYTAVLAGQVRDIRASAPQLARLTAEKAQLVKDQALVEKQLAALNSVAGHLGQLGGEPYDNGRWLGTVATLRDLYAPSLVFERVSYDGPTLSFTGAHDEVQQVLLIVKHLARALGEDAVQMGTFARATDGRTRFSFEIHRPSARPPNLGVIGK